jgi:hypothetical protein
MVRVASPHLPPSRRRADTDGIQAHMWHLQRSCHTTHSIVQALLGCLGSFFTNSVIVNLALTGVFMSLASSHLFSLDMTLLVKNDPRHPRRACTMGSSCWSCNGKGSVSSSFMSLASSHLFSLDGWVLVDPNQYEAPSSEETDDERTIQGTREGPALWDHLAGAVMVRVASPHLPPSN